MYILNFDRNESLVVEIQSNRSLVYCMCVGVTRTRVAGSAVDYARFG